MSQLMRVQYVENARDGKGQRIRWGYLTPRDLGLLRDFQKKENTEDARITVFLPDGTTGDAALSHLSFAPSFATNDNMVHLGDQHASNDS